MSSRKEFKRLKKQEGRKFMNGKQGRRAIPMQVPNLGGQQQVQIDVENDTIEKHCQSCGGEHFDAVYRLRTLPSISPKNPSGKDVLIKTEVYLYL